MAMPFIDPLPSAPTPADPEAVFDDKAYEMVAALTPFVEQTNTLALAVEAEAIRSENEADRSQAQVNVATTEANRAQAEAERAKDEADRAEQARDDAVVVVTEGQGSLTPAPGKFPVAGTSGTIKQDWIENLQFELDALRVAKNKALYGDGPYPVLDLQFQGAKMLDPRITFTRSTPDWDWEGNRYEINEPVLSDEGLWLRASRTNLATYSNDFTKWSKSETGSGKIQITERFGEYKGLSTTRILFTRETAEDRAALTRTILTTGDIPRTQSVWVRNLGESGVNVTFSISSNDSIALPPKKWMRIALTKSLATNMARLGLFVLANSNEAELEVCGFMFEEGEYNTPHIPTLDSQVTVSASKMTLKTSDNMDSPQGGAIIADYMFLKKPTDPGFIFRVGAIGQQANFIGLDYTTGTVGHTNISYYRNGNVYFLNDVRGSEAKVGQTRKVGYSWSRGAVKDASGGVVRSKEFEYVPPILATTNGVFFAKMEGSPSEFSAVIKSLTLYNQPLTDEQLQDLTL